MLKQEQENRSQMEFFCVDEFVPQDHLLRKIEKLVDFSHIYGLVEELYCPDNGRPSCDSVVLFKMVIIQHLYGIPSLRRTVEEIKMNVAYRWFLGYTMADKMPFGSTRKLRKNSSRSLPNSSISAKSSPPHITVHSPITMISSSLCLMFPYLVLLGSVRCESLSVSFCIFIPIFYHIFVKK